MGKYLPAGFMEKVSQFIESRTALHFPMNRWNDLEQKLKFAATEFGFNDHEAFCRWLVSSRMDAEQEEILVSHLTISETYFWREPRVFDALEETILPELIREREKEGKRLRIWSVGCATGEEPYSLAIAIKRAIPDLTNWNITILATDINPRILKRAAAGIYSEWSFRNSPVWLKDKYFTRVDNKKYQISSEIRNMVNFTYLNLAEDNFPSSINNTNAMDIVFCRNVLMYFTCTKIKQIGERLFQSLVKQGWFMVSSSELSQQFFPQFTPIHFLEAIVYRKTDQKPSSNFTIQPFMEPVEAQQFLGFTSEFVLMEKETSLQRPIPEISQELPSIQSQTTLPVEEKQTIAATDITIQVRELANNGNLKEALSTCEQLIIDNKLDPNLYFLQSNILQELNRDQDAIESLKRTLYIDSDFYMGYFALGNLMLHQGKKQIAKKYFENALSILAKFHQNDVLISSEGLTAGRLREIVYATMQAGV